MHHQSRYICFLNNDPSYVKLQLRVVLYLVPDGLANLTNCSTECMHIIQHRIKLS
jgi:hypothetical protein